MKIKQKKRILWFCILRLKKKTNKQIDTLKVGQFNSHFFFAGTFIELRLHMYVVYNFLHYIRFTEQEKKN